MECAIGAIRETLMKDKEDLLLIERKKWIAVGCIPIEACADTTEKIASANDPGGKYAGDFKIGPSEKFEAGRRFK